MKKFSICLSFLALLGTAANAFSAQAIIQQIYPAASNFGKNALNNRLSTAEQNASLNTWVQSFNTAKAYVIDNSKNSVGVRDSDIISALNALEKANNDIINVIKVSRGLTTGVQLKNQQTILANVQRALVAALNKLSGTSMILNNKKEAKSVILSIGKFLEQVIQAFDGMIQTKISNVAPALPPRKQQPSAPSRQAPAIADNVAAAECIICFEPAGIAKEPCKDNPNKICERKVTLVKIPCKNNHPDMICTDDLKEIKATTNKCPMCQAQLL